MKIRKLAVALALLPVSVAAIAGYTMPVPVDIVTYAADEMYPGSPAGGSAQGDLISARNSRDNDNELIGCGIRTFDDGAGGIYYLGFCQANITSDIETTIDTLCFTEDLGLLEGIKAIGDSAYITFTWEEITPELYECTAIGTSTNSFYLEKGKPNN